MKKLTFFLLCLEGAVLSFNVAATAAIVPSVAKDFALSQFLAGKIVWLYMLPYGLAALIYGPLVRLIDAKKIELFCLFFFSLANLLAGLSGSIYMLFACRLMMGIFGASVIPLALILIARHIEPDKRGRLIGIFFSATFIASLLGLLLSAVIPWRMIYIIPAILGFITWGIVYFYLPSFKTDVSKFQLSYIAAFKDKAVLFIFLYIFLVSFIYHGIQQWLGVYFSTQYSFTQFVISMLITLTSLSGIFGEVIGGRLADKLGRIKTIDIGLILMLIIVLGLIARTNLFVLALLMIAWGFGWTLNHAGLSTALTDLPDKFLNEAASLNSSVRFLSGGIGAAAGGALMQRSFNFGFIVFAIGLIALLFLSREIIISK
ncbi:MAG: MFS transporter [Candidatus Omnitrophota bacterium]|nr:MAG: MFS transporter [Candidatus Omnitrophota bacterium]